MKIPTFETNRLILRETRLEDAPSYQKNFCDYEVIRHLAAACPWPYPPDGALNFIKEFIFPNQGKNRWFWSIFLKENLADMIGVVELWREGKPENRGFWLAKKHWGKGLMTEAVTPVMDYAFNELGFEKLIFSNARGNIGSRKVKEKTGATFVRFEPAKFVDSKYTEREVWELTKENWVKFKANSK
jgi:[ribosomal protein S5]-alanine N-acetyltransferase